MYRHAWESILAFSCLQDLSRAARVSHTTLEAVRYMKPASLDIVCDLDRIQRMHHVFTTTIMKRHVGEVTLRDTRVHAATELASQIELDITKIDMGHPSDADNAMACLTRVLQTNTTIRQVSLYDSSPSANHLRRLFDALKSNHSVLILELNSVKLFYQGAVHLASLIESNTFIHTLHLSDNRCFGNASMALLISSLKKNSTIASIRFHYNHIDDEHVLLLANMLQSNNTITSLELNMCWIRDVQHLVAALKYNTTLKTLDLEKNQMSEEGALALCEAVGQHTSITHLNLRNNPNISRVCSDALSRYFNLYSPDKILTL